MTRSERVTFRLTPVQLLDLEERARQDGVKVGRWLQNHLWPEPTEKEELSDKPVGRSLCERCRRIGVPSCAQCRHVFFGEPVANVSGE